MSARFAGLRRADDNSALFEAEGMGRFTTSLATFGHMIFDILADRGSKAVLMCNSSATIPGHVHR